MKKSKSLEEQLKENSLAKKNADSWSHATHPFTGNGSKCEYDWPNGDEPSEQCGLPRSAHIN